MTSTLMVTRRVLKVDSAGDQRVLQYSRLKGTPRSSQSVWKILLQIALGFLIVLAIPLMIWIAMLLQYFFNM